VAENGAVVQANQLDTMDFTYSNFISNSALLDGGVMYFNQLGDINNGRVSSLTLKNCIFLTNKAGHYGGGLYIKKNSGISSLDLQNVTFDSNVAQRAGSWYVRNMSNPPVEDRNTVHRNNSVYAKSSDVTTVTVSVNPQSDKIFSGDYLDEIRIDALDFLNQSIFGDSIQPLFIGISVSNKPYSSTENISATLVGSTVKPAFGGSTAFKNIRLFANPGDYYLQVMSFSATGQPIQQHGSFKVTIDTCPSHFHELKTDFDYPDCVEGKLINFSLTENILTHCTL
jgi:archaellin